MAQSQTKPLRQMGRIEWIAANGEEPVVDIGCGDSVYFDEDVDYTGLDIDPDSEDMKEGRPHDFVEGDAHDLPFEDNSYDTALLGEVLEHVDNPVKVIQEAKRVAYNQVLITVPDERRWLPEAKPGEHEDHKRMYSGKKLMDQCKRAGFDRGCVTIDHLNEFPFVFWLATCDVVPDSIV